MDVYRVGHEVFSFVASSVNAPLQACKLNEQDSLTVSLSTIQRLEQDARIMTMIGSLLDYLGAISTHLLEEVILEEGVSEGTCRLV